MQTESISENRKIAPSHNNGHSRCAHRRREQRLSEGLAVRHDDTTRMEKEVAPPHPLHNPQHNEMRPAQ